VPCLAGLHERTRAIDLEKRRHSLIHPFARRFDPRALRPLHKTGMPVTRGAPNRALLPPATFNARAETVADKPMSRPAFQRTRCLIPAPASKAVGQALPAPQEMWRVPARESLGPR